MVERELLVDADDGVADALVATGFSDEAHHLAAAIRAGEVDGADQPVRTALRALVGRRIAAAHPGYRDG